jgi:hypothetical protein
VEGRVRDKKTEPRILLSCGMILFVILFAPGCKKGMLPPSPPCVDSVTIKVDCSIPDANYVCVNRNGTINWDEKGSGTAGAKFNFLIKFKKETPLRIFNNIRKYEVVSTAGTSGMEKIGTDVSPDVYYYSLSCENGRSVDPMIRVP